MIVTFWKLESCKIGYAEYRIWEDLLKNDEFSENFRNQADKSENFPLGADHTCLKSRIPSKVRRYLINFGVKWREMSLIWEPVTT